MDFSFLFPVHVMFKCVNGWVNQIERSIIEECLFIGRHATPIQLGSISNAAPHCD